MNQEQIASYSPEMAGLSNEGDPIKASLMEEEQMKSIDDHHKRNVLGKVKEKARKLKTKIRKPKSGVEEAGGESLSEDESGSDQELNQPEEIYVKMEAQMPEETSKDVSGLLSDAMKDSTLIPDAKATTPGSALGVHEELFGKTYSTSTDSAERLQEEVPAAPGQTSAGVTPYLNEHDIGKNAESSENPQPMDTEEVLNRNEPKKSMFEQAKQKIFGTSKSFTEGTRAQAGDESNKSPRPSLTSRAADTMMSFKDAFTSKLGYGAKSPLNRSMSDKGERMEPAKEPSKSVLQKVQDTALNTALNTFETVVSKIGPTEVVDTVEVKDSDKITNDAASEIAPGPKDAGSSEGNVSVEGSGRFHPGEEDRALSQLITEKLSVGATTLKDTLLRPFGSNPGSAAPTPLPESSSASDLVPNASDDVGGIITTETQEVDAGSTRGGIVSAVGDTVSAVGEKMSSLLTKGSEAGTGKSENLGEHTGGLIASVRDTVSSLVSKGNDGAGNIASVSEPRMRTDDDDSGGIISTVSDTVSSLIGKGKEEEDLRKTNIGDEAGICKVEMQQAS